MKFSGTLVEIWKKNLIFQRGEQAKFYTPVEELEDQQRREFYIQDQRGALQLAESRGLEKGIEKGKLEGKLEVARRMLEKGMAREEAAELSGLSLDEMRELGP